MLRHGAFHSVGTRSDAAAGDAGFMTLSDVDRAGSWSTLIAPRGEHRELDEVPTALVVDFLIAIRDQIRAAREHGATAYIQFVRNAAAQAGAMTESFRSALAGSSASIAADMKALGGVLSAEDLRACVGRYEHGFRKVATTSPDIDGRAEQSFPTRLNHPRRGGDIRHRATAGRPHFENLHRDIRAHARHHFIHTI